jgi:hypothetical protein
MEMTNALKYGLIVIGLIVCIGLKLYFGNNPIVADVDAGIESIVKEESGYDITPIVDVV